MNIENFFWDKVNHSVSWSYNGKDIKENYENMFFATADLEKEYIFIEAGQNYSQDQIYYISFDGKLIFSFDKVVDKISWQHKNQLIEISKKNIVNAQMYFNNDIIMAIIVNSQNDKKIVGYTLDGSVLFQKEPPIGYQFMRLSMSKNIPTVVCDGGDANADAYGRSEFHFKIDTKTGDMIKGSLAY